MLLRALGRDTDVQSPSTASSDATTVFHALSSSVLGWAAAYEVASYVLLGTVNALKQSTRASSVVELGLVRQVIAADSTPMKETERNINRP